MSFFIVASNKDVEKKVFEASTSPLVYTIMFVLLCFLPIANIQSTDIVRVLLYKVLLSDLHIALRISLTILSVILIFIILVLFSLFFKEKFKDIQKLFSSIAPITKIRKSTVKQMNKKLNSFFFEKYEIERIKFIYKNMKIRKDIGAQNCLLISGPPGTGKTALAKLLCPHGYLVYLSQIIQYKEIGVKMLEMIFKRAQEENLTLIFDDGDIGLLHRDISSSDKNIKAIITFMMFYLSYVKTPIILTVNHDKILDAAFSRRFQDYIVIGYPTKNKILGILKKDLKKRLIKLLDLNQMADLFNNLSVRDINIIVLRLNQYYETNGNVTFNNVVELYNETTHKSKALLHNNIHELHLEFIKDNKIMIK